MMTTRNLLRWMCRYSSSSSASGSHNNEVYWLQRAVLTVGSGIGSLLYPERADLVFTFGETTGYFALQCMRSRMMQDETGRHILQTKPRIRTDTIDLSSLRDLPAGTLGREYIRFMDHYGYSPDDREDVRYIDDPELAYVMQRYRELHDFMHTLLGMPTNVYGEIIVKQFEAVQTGLPLCVLGGLFTPLTKLSINQQLEISSVYTPWAIKNGLMAKFLMNVYFERHFEESLVDLRRQFQLTEPPSGSLNNNLWKNTL